MTSENGDIFLATAAASSSSGKVRILFDGESEAGSKTYKIMNGSSISSGARILVLKISGTYVVLGKIS